MMKQNAVSARKTAEQAAGRERSFTMFIADFHIHSKYSRATSRELVPELLELWARRKGLDLVGTGDFTHPAWREELSKKLIPAEEGLYRLKEEFQIREHAAYHTEDRNPRFILSGEISSIYKKDGKVRKVHNLILLPSLDAGKRLSLRLEQVGNLHSDGRPILGLPSRDLLELTLEVCPEAIFIPAHIWTPHFSLFGAYSGFDTIEECFEDLTPHIHALETGLSSDPPMIRRLSKLDRYTLVSNSDAHSPSKLAREANVFYCPLSYANISYGLSHPTEGGFGGTIEFFPEEGKYHFDGHRNCKICLSPTEALKALGVCPVCGRPLTKGVLHRVEELADREESFFPPDAPSFQHLIPLPELIAAVMGYTTASKRVQRQYEELLSKLGSELYLLRQSPLEDISRFAGEALSQAICRLRQGQLRWSPGYDGEYGRVILPNL